MIINLDITILSLKVEKQSTHIFFETCDMSSRAHNRCGSSNRYPPLCIDGHKQEYCSGVRIKYTLSG